MAKKIQGDFPEAEILELVLGSGCETTEKEQRSSQTEGKTHAKA